MVRVGATWMENADAVGTLSTDAEDRVEVLDGVNTAPAPDRYRVGGPPADRYLICALLIGEAWTYRRNLIVQDVVHVVLAAHLDAPLLTGDRRIAGAPNLPIRVLHLSVAD